MFKQANIRTVITTKFENHTLSPIIFPCKPSDNVDYSEQMHTIAYAMQILPDFCEIKDRKFFCCGICMWFFISLKITYKELFVFHCSYCVAVKEFY